MKHAIAELSGSLLTLIHNEPIHRAEGDIETANLEAAKIAEFRDVISLLKAFDHLKDRGWFTPQPTPSGRFNIDMPAVEGRLEELGREDRDLLSPAKPTTIRGWLETLPDGYRERALANTSSRAMGWESQNLLSAFSGAFVWDDSPEGYRFWSDIAHGRDLPPLPES